MNLQTSDIEGKTFEEKIEEWADKVVDYCNKTALVIDKTFYVFQKSVLPIKEINREILILGINPGGDFNFTSQYNNLDGKWQSDGKFNEKEMTRKGLLSGNPYYTNYQEWNISKLSKLEAVKSILDTENYYFMNYIYFNTPNIIDFNKLDKNGEIKRQCIEFTNQFIKLINPKRILVLGTQNGIDQLSNVKSKKVVLGSRQRLVIQAEYLDYPMVAIPHPSYFSIRIPEELNAMNETLQKLFNGEQVEERTLNVKNFFVKLSTKINAIELIDIFRKDSFGVEITKDERKTIRYNIKDKNNDVFELVITATGAGYVAIRRVSRERKENDPIVEMLSKIGFRESKSWLGEKHFKDYSAENEIGLAKKIKEDITHFINKLK